MAYTSFSEPGAAIPFVGGTIEPGPDQPSLSALEWSVIALARRDSLASLREPGRVARAMAAIFGQSSGNRFADPRLEALRRLAVHAWRRGFAVPDGEIQQFCRAGYSVDQLELLLTSIGRARNAPRKKA